MNRASALGHWQQKIIPQLSGKPVHAPDTTNVTAVAYFFWDDERIDSLFYTIESAFLVTRHLCGALPSLLIVNRLTPRIETFCAANQIQIQVDPTLTGGVPRMNLDCMQTLHTRFDTEYALIIQSDGFPLRKGLAEFVGCYDYIGAPWGPASWFTNLVFPYPKYCVGNGGFSLRSKRLCEMSAYYYRRKYRFLPYGYWVADDVFYSKTLPRFEKTCRKTMVYAPPAVAGRFAVEADRTYYALNGEMPFGFHAQHGFATVMHDFADQIEAQLI